jgi:D-aminopeptidase
MTDIVERLRLTPWANTAEVKEAADEIERLREQAQRDTESIRALVKYAEGLEAQLVERGLAHFYEANEHDRHR